MKVLAIAEHNNHELLPATLHTVNAAKQIGDTDLLVVGHNCQEVIDNARKIDGLNQVLYCNDEMYKNSIAENLSVLIKSTAQNYSHILFSNTANGKNTAPRLAALLDVMIVPDVIEIIDQNIELGNTLNYIISADLMNFSLVKPKNSNIVNCKLISEEYIGSMVTLFLESVDGTEFKIQMQEREHSKLNIQNGEKYWLSWSKKNVHTLKKD